MWSNHILVNLPKGEVLPSLGVVEKNTVHFPSPWEEFTKTLLHRRTTNRLSTRSIQIQANIGRKFRWHGACILKKYSEITMKTVNLYKLHWKSKHLGEGGWYFTNIEVDGFGARLLAVLHDWAKTTLLIRIERARLVIECSWVPAVYVAPGVSKEGYFCNTKQVIQYYSLTIIATWRYSRKRWLRQLSKLTLKQLQKVFQHLNILQLLPIVRPTCGKLGYEVW